MTTKCWIAVALRAAAWSPAAAPGIAIAPTSAPTATTTVPAERTSRDLRAVMVSSSVRCPDSESRRRAACRALGGKAVRLRASLSLNNHAPVVAAPERQVQLGMSWTAGSRLRTVVLGAAGAMARREDGGAGHADRRLWPAGQRDPRRRPGDTVWAGRRHGATRER